MNRPTVHSSPRWFAAFSVMELLVALAVLAVVAFFSLAALRSATMKTRQVASASTIRGIGQALALYVGDHGELPGKCHTRNPPYFAISNKLITYIWPYLGRTKRPQQGELLPEYVPAHMISWIKAHNNPAADGSQGDVILYRLGYSPTLDGVTYTLWGYPGVAEERARWNTLVALFPLSRLKALHDIAPTDQNGIPKFGELQNYTTTLYLDWHVKISRP